MDIKFEGVDCWNRPVFKDVDSKARFGSVQTLFNDNDDVAIIVKYFKSNIYELEYFGNVFGCEPHGGLEPNLKLNIVM